MRPVSHLQMGELRAGIFSATAIASQITTHSVQIVLERDNGLGASMDTSDWAKNLVERKKKELQEKRTKDDKLHAQLEKK